MAPRNLRRKDETAAMNRDHSRMILNVSLLILAGMSLGVMLAGSYPILVARFQVLVGDLWGILGGPAVIIPSGLWYLERKRKRKDDAK